MRFIESFLQKAKEIPDLVLMDDCQGTQLTYEQTDQMSGRVYRYLKERGIGREDFVCILLPRGVLPFAALIGVWKAGAAFVLLEEGYPAERVAYIRQDCGCKLLLDSSAWKEILDCEPLDGYEEAGDHDAAFAVYTSGSTGTPKGVLHEYGNLDRIAVSMPDATRGGLIAPLNFIASLEIFIRVVHLGVVMLIVPREVLKDPQLLAPCFVSNDIREVFCAPSIYRLFRQIPSLKVIFVGSEPAYGVWSEDPELSVYNCYSMSESGIMILMGKLDKPNEIAPLGIPVIPIGLMLLDEEGQPVPEGETGEICFENTFVRGYIHHPEETAKVFRNGLFHTGDMARQLPDGSYVMAGRADDMVKINGNRVEPAEIETVFRRITGNEQVLVKGFIEGDSAWICLYYASKDAINAETIRTEMQKELPYYMIPARFVRLDSLPRTASGKLSRRLLEKPASEEAGGSFVPPENEEERVLCESMAEVLRLKQVGAEDDFYEIGGSSVTSMALVTRCPLSGLNTDLIFAGRTPRRIASLWREGSRKAPVSEEGGTDLSRPWPLTQTQLGIYLDCERMKGEAIYNNPLLLCMPPETDAEGIRRALEMTLPAHPALFARIEAGEDGMPAMRYDPSRLRDLCGPVTRLTEEAFAKKKKTLCRAFDLAEDRLFRAELYLTEKHLYLFLDFHHIIYDGTSGHILMQELARACRGKAPEKETYTAFDLAREETELRRSEQYSLAKSWAMEQFGSVEGTALPEGDLREKTKVIGRKKIPLDVSLKSFRAFCALRQMTENVVSTAAFGYLLSVYQRRTDAAFSTIYNGRKDDRTARTVAMMVKTLPVLCRTDRNQTVHAYLTAVRDQMLGAMAHDVFSFAELAEKTGISGNVQFAWQDEMHEAGNAAEMGITLEEVPFNATGEALSVELLAHEGRLVMDISFHANRYSERFIETLASAYSQVLQDFITRQRLSEVRLMSREERERVLALSRGEELPYDESETWIDLFQKQAKRAPDHPAVTDRDSSYTYAELDAASDRIAGWLIQNGVKEDTFVAVQMGRVKEFTAAVLGIQKAGAGYVPIDPEYPEDRIAFMLEDSEAQVILTEEKIREILAEPAADWDGQSRATPDSLAYMIYTSGTTGQPKGVVIQQKALSNLVQFIRKHWRLTEESRIAIHSTFSFDASVEDLYPVLTAGGELFIVPEEVRKDVFAMREYLAEHRITGGCYSTQFGQLLGKDAALNVDYVCLGGEAMTSIPQTEGRVYNTYGPTEFTVDATYHEIDPNRTYDTIPIGRPLDNCAGYILDDSLHLVPAGMAGELCLAGPQMAQGYWKRPELTAEKFCESADLPGIRIYRTGDLARYNERGELEYLGRIDTQVKLRGFRIELGEIENRAAQYKGVREACAEVRQEQLVLYYTLREEARPASDEDTDTFREGLKAFLAETLADYMVPTAYMELAEMPLTPAGKIDRKALPEPVRTDLGEIVPPETETEKALYEIAAGILGTEAFGVTTDLVALGLSSIGAMRLAAETAQRLGMRVGTAEILKQPTIRAIAEAGAHENEGETALRPREKREYYPITENQRGILVDWQLNQGTTQYNIPDVSFFENTEGEALAEAVRQAVCAHPALRTRFEYRGGDIMQRRNDGEAPEVSVTALAEKPDEAFFRERVRPFDLMNERLYRLEVYTCGKDAWLFMDIHHTVFDGISGMIFLEDVRKALAGETLAPETVTAWDYALYEQEQLTGESFEKMEQRFDALVEGAQTAVLPSDGHPDGKPEGMVTLRMPAEKINAFCEKCEVTPGSYLQAAFAETVRRISREEKILYTTISSGRSAGPALMNTVGMFVRTLPAVSVGAKDQNTEDYVREMHSQLVESFGMEIYPYTRLVERHRIKAEMMFAYQGGLDEDDGNTEAETDSEEMLDAVKMPVSVDVWPEDDSYVLAVEYDGTRYGKQEILRFAKALRAVSESLAEAEKVGDAVLTDPEERERVLTLSRGEELPYDESETWIDLFQKQVKKAPDHPAVTDRDSSYTYAELDAASDRIAGWLIQNGVKEDTFVAVQMGRVKEFTAAVLGIQKAGAGYVPIDPEYPEDRIAFMLEDSEAQVILTEEKIREILAESPDDGKENMPIVDWDGQSRATPESLAYMIYTSGTTGQPKGVVIQQKALSNLVQFIRKHWRLTEESRIAIHSTFSFDASVEDLYPVLTAGGELFIVPEEIRKDVFAMREYLTARRITGGCYSTQFGQLLGKDAALNVDYVCLGGEAMTSIPQTEGRVYNTYGPTEFTVDATYHEIDPNRTYDTIPIGRPLDNCAGYILDDSLHLVPAGFAGELCLAGPQMAQGYWKRPELTAEKFCESADLPGIRIYRTGDLARYNERGELEYLGRIDTQVKLRGFRIELGEIENRAARYKGIREACAEVRQEQLVLYYTLREEARPASDEDTDTFREGLKAFLAETLADYMVPTAYMELAEMPLTPAGKIDRKALPEPVLADLGEIVPPETETEKALFEIAAGILGTEAFGVTTDLVALGLSSIGAMRLAAETAQRLGMRVGTAEILKQPTIRAIAEAGAHENEGETALRPREKREYYPITENQRGILVDWQLNQGTTQYNIPDVSFFENTEGEALAEAVRQAVSAHPALRTRFEYRDGDVMQRRNDGETPEVSVISLTEKPDEAFFQERVRPFDLMGERLYRLEVYTCDKDAWLFMDIHHTVFDGISGMIFLEDVRRALAGEALAPETVTAWDYALYEREMLTGESFEKMEQRFDALVEGAQTAVLPSDGHPDGKPEGMVTLRMPAEKINAFCEKCGVTPGSYLQAAFAETVRRISREEKILYTTISSGRSAGPALMNTVGMFVRTLPVVSVGAKEQNTEDYVREMHSQLVESFGMEIYPYTRLVERHRIKAEMMFAYQGGLDEGGSGDAGTESAPETASEEMLDAVKMPVSVDVWPEDDSYVLAVEYDGTRYGKQEMLRFAKALRAVSESLAEAEKIGDAVLTDPEERERVLELSRGEELPYDENETWIDLFQKQAKRAPDHPAVTDRDSSYTYAELDAASDQIAGWLIQNGVKEDTFVAIQMGRVKEFTAAALGIQKAGAGYVPIDPEYPEDRIAFMLEDSEAQVILTEEKIREILAEPAADWDGQSRATPDSLAYMIYTSGTTGQPKGVVIQQKALSNLVQFIRKHWRLTEESRIAIHSTFSFDASVEDLYPVLTVGGTQFIVPEEIRKDVFAMREFLTARRITGGCYSTQFGQLLGKDATLNVDYVCLGGEAMTSIPQTEGRVYNTYGPTEFTVDATYHEIDPNRTYDTIPIGRPLDNCAGYILDGSLHLVPAGMAGELCLAGPQMAQGYWKRPELTAEKFCESADLPGIRIYRTGDLARYNERGELEYLGRIDTQVKLRGFRIELGEIENRAARYKGIREACAEVRQEQLVLYYTLREEARPASDEDTDTFREGLKAFLAETLADYMVPTAYMELAEMPLNTSGKIDRKALPEPVRTDLGEIVPPETETEKALYEIAAGILGTEAFGVTTDLVALGLSSIGAMRLASETAQRLGMRVGTAEILKQPTIRAIAEAGAHENEGETALRPREKREYYPITENQRGILVDWELNQGTTQYNIPDVSYFENTDGEALAEAVRQAVCAHPALRTRFEYRDGDVMQRRNDGEAPEVSVISLTEKPDEAFFRERVRPFDLMGERLYRLEVYTCGKDAWLFMDIHHTVFDGISGMIFLEDVRRALAGETLTPETVTAWDYALYEREQLTGESFEKMEQRFDALVEGAQTAVLPSDGHPDGKPEGMVTLRMPAEKINAFCEKCGVTPGSYLQAAFAETVRRISREEKILYTTISSGRSAGPALMNTVGMFVRTLPVVSVGAKDQNTEDYVREMHSQLVESFGMEIYPYTRLVERHRTKAEMMFAYQGGLDEDDSGNAGTESAPETASEEMLDAVKMPVSVDVWPEDGSYVLAVEYDGTRYGKQEMLRFAKALRAVSESLAEAEKVGDAVLTDPEERERVLALSRGEELPYDESETWIDLFQKQAKRAPDHPAVTDRDSSYTYAELDAASDQIAGWLIQNGVKEDTFVAIQMGRVKEFTAAALGIQKAGAGYVPIDPEYPEDRIAFMLEDSEAQVILTEEKIREILAEPAADWDGQSRATPDSLAYMIYTSGTTGQPKGVVIQQKALSNLVQFIRKHWRLTEESRIAIHSTFSFDASVEDLYPVLTAGGELFIVPEEIRKDVFAMREFLTAHRITGGCYSTQFGQLLGKDAALNVDYVCLGGEAMTSIPQTEGRVYNTYGPTEFTVDATYHEIDPNRTYDTIPIGRPLDNCTGYILDGSLHLVPAGMAGELCLAGPQMAQGYWKRPELTAEKFCESADLPGIRIYRTGDLARYNERGELEYLGRIDTQVKLRGFRIELGEVENRAAHYAGIREACAEVRQEQLVLYYTLREEARPASDEDTDTFREGLKAFLAETLADYMVPTAYMELAEMPLTPAGKIDRKALPEPEALHRGEIIPPQTPLQEQLCGIFRDALMIEDIGINENFFEIGGTSIRAMKVLLQMMSQGIPLNYQDLYNHPRVEELEQLIIEKQNGGSNGSEGAPLNGQSVSEAHTLNCLSRNRVDYLGGLTFRDLGNILLVGATGFLGAHMLKALLEKTSGTIYCLIRPGRLGAEKRFREIMFYYFEETFEELVGSRIVLIEGDPLSAESLEKVGAYDIQTVINCAASVKHFASLDSLMQANVELVDRLIDLCVKKKARLIHNSTTSVAGSVMTLKDGPDALREDQLDIGQITEDNGYVHTKFLAEKHVLAAVEERGLDAKIMRLGNLMSRTTDGEFQMNFNTNNFFRTLWAFAELECIPYSILTDEEEFSPINEVAEAIVLLSGTDSRFTVFHPYNCHHVQLGDIVYALNREGYPIQAVNDEEFRARVHAGIADPETGIALSPLFMYDTDQDDQVTGVPADNTFTTMALYRLGFHWSMTDMNYLEAAIRNVGEMRL